MRPAVQLQVGHTDANDENKNGVQQNEAVQVNEEQGDGAELNFQEEKRFTGTLTSFQIRPLAALTSKQESSIEESVEVKGELQDLKPFTGNLAPLQINPLDTPKNEILQVKQNSTEESSAVKEELQDLKPFTGPLAPLTIQPVPPPARPPPPPSKRKYTCVVCNKGVGTEGGLKYHLRTHLLGRPFKCDVCDRTFATKNDLDTHSRRHSEKFYCDYCSKEFPAKDYMRTHISIHHLPKYIPCVNCCKEPKFFSTKKNLRIHYSVKNRARRPIKVKAICKLCGARFAALKKYEKHCANRELLKYSCKRCGMKFPCFMLVQAHIKKEKGEQKKFCYSCRQMVMVKDLKMHRCVKRVIFACKKCKSFETEDVNVLVSHTRACGVEEVHPPVTAVAAVLEKPQNLNPPKESRPSPSTSKRTIMHYFGTRSNSMSVASPPASASVPTENSSNN